jgi:hypothetical protein
MLAIALSGCTTPHNSIRFQLIFNVILQRDSQTRFNQRAPVVTREDQESGSESDVVRAK